VAILQAGLRYAMGIKVKEFLTDSVYFGVIISIAGYILGLKIKKKFKCGVFNPLLISILFVMAALLILKVDYESYNNSAKFLSYLLTPATVCLAIPLYQQLELLKKNLKAILLGILAGMMSSLGSVLALAYLFGLSHEQYVTLLPKSITTAIGMGISDELGGITTITVAVIIITGVLGNITAGVICKIFKIQEPIAVGLAIGTSSHAIGTAKALEIGEIEGAMSSLSIAVTGLLTVIGASVFANFL
jgi:predicted murein hydrolase (TIGR00659 family)